MVHTATTALRVAETQTTNDLPLTTVQSAVATPTLTLLLHIRYVLLEIIVTFVTDIFNFIRPISYPRIKELMWRLCTHLTAACDDKFIKPILKHAS